MTRETSAEAYAYLVSSGALARAQAAVYSALYLHGPLTRNELDRRLAGPGQPNPTFSRRLADMERMGVIRRVGVRPCAITGRNADAWDVTSQVVPAKLEKSKPLRVLFEQALQAIATGAGDPTQIAAQALQAAGRAP
jgi:hypothetical protein